MSSCGSSLFIQDAKLRTSTSVLPSSRRLTSVCLSPQEHHLQRAISAQQVYGEKRDNMVIPVPEAESNITYYESLYPGEFKMPKQLIHIQRKCGLLLM